MNEFLMVVWLIALGAVAWQPLYIMVVVPLKLLSIAIESEEAAHVRF